MDVTGLWKPFTRDEELAVARSHFRYGLTLMVGALISEKWAGDHKNPSRGVASACFATGLAVMCWFGVWAGAQERRKADT